jgi:hypothetical protein
MEAITAVGANRLRVIALAVLPRSSAVRVYLIYQWDINIRMATIIGLPAATSGWCYRVSSGCCSITAGTVVLHVAVVA